MAWSKVQQPWNKPLKWWYYKILCELGYTIGGSNHSMYHYGLKKMLASTIYNLYGQKIK